MEIKIPKINFENEDKEVDIFVGIYLKANKNRIKVSGGFAKPQYGKTKTQKEKQQKEAEKKKQSKTLKSEKSGEVQI